jgi:hypothetical protein
MGQYEDLRGAITRQGRLNRETTVTQSRLTRSFISNLFEKAANQNRSLSGAEINAIKTKIENESQEIQAAIDAANADADPTT